MNGSRFCPFPDIFCYVFLNEASDKRVGGSFFSKRKGPVAYYDLESQCKLSSSTSPSFQPPPDTPRTASNRKLASKLDSLMSTLTLGEEEEEEEEEESELMHEEIELNF
jgi:hypothetical protein